MSSYTWEENGFVIIEQFFQPEELRRLHETANRQISKTGPDAYSTFAVSRYDAIQQSDCDSQPHLQRMAAAAQKTMGGELAFFNSLYLELHAAKIEEKPGLAWHQDTASFLILEKGARALFCWTMLSNELEDGQGTLEFILREKVEQITGCDVRERCVIVFDTQDLNRRHGINLTWKAKFVLLDAVTYQILAFFDTPLDDFAERPVLRPGDLVICNKDVMHRSAPSKAAAGLRSALTLRFVDPDARYNGCLDGGVPLYLYGVACGSQLWQRLQKEGRGARICAGPTS
jgi:hypothetical protein